MIGAFACGAVLFTHLLALPGEDRIVHEVLFSWVPVGVLRVDFGLQLDALSMCFVLLITGVGGALIHIYSIGYMKTDPGRRRFFFAYLNLFVAAMLLLVLADNYLGLYMGWEGVGLASYLLIGFWSHKPSAATAAKKAFVVNRVGDMGLAIALMVLFATLGSVTYSTVFGAVPQMTSGVLTAVGLLLLLGACGKSAQVPLQSWLGDAMEGPTPVSALIHAATMVTAGVYLIVRSGPIFTAAPAAQVAVVTVGAVTLLFGAIIGCAKDDIKKSSCRVHDVADRLHGAGRRVGPGRVCGGDHAPAHPWLLQGRAVPRRRIGHARHGRRNRHASLRRPAHAAAHHVCHLRARLPRHHRCAALRRLLLQRRDHRNRTQLRRSPRLAAGWRRPPRRRYHRVLHDPRHAAHLLRPEAVEARYPPARIPPPR